MCTAAKGSAALHLRHHFLNVVVLFLLDALADLETRLDQTPDDPVLQAELGLREYERLHREVEERAEAAERWFKDIQAQIQELLKERTW